MTSRDLQMVCLWWRDAHAVTDTWTAIEELDDEPCIVHSIGFLLRDVKPGHIVLAQSMIDGEEYGDVDHVLAIPSAMVVRIESLHQLPLIPVEPPA